MPLLPPTVCFWPESLDNIPIDQSLIVIALRTLPTTFRFQARKLIRIAIRQVLAKKLNCQYAEIELISHLGQSLKLSQPRQNIGLSVSHESGLSLAAININGSVGVDLINIKTIPNTREIKTLALEYLGAEVAEHLSNLSCSQQKYEFAHAWSGFEARLKCQKKGLSEWTALSALQLNTLSIQPLNLPDDYVGTIAFSD